MIAGCAFDTLIPQFSEHLLSVCRMLSNHSVYLPYNNILHEYSQYDSVGKSTALIQIIGGSATVLCNYTCDAAEITDFLHMTGVTDVFTECRDIAYRFGNAAALNVLTCNGICPVRCDMPDAEPDWRKIHSLICCCGLAAGEYDYFLSDITLKFRSGHAHIYTQDSAAVCFTAWETDDAAIISALAVDKAHTHMGIGSSLIKRVCGDLCARGKQILLYTDEHTAQFYIKNGFTGCGSVYSAVRPQK